MGTGRGAAGRARRSGQDAPKAPRTGQEALAPPDQCVCPSPDSGAIVGHPWKPEPLTWPRPHVFEDGKVDDLDRHLAARAALWRAVVALVAARPKEFPARVYLAIGDNGSRERTGLLREFGGLPRETEWWLLNGVPAATLGKAVAQMVECFGLDNGASGNPAGARVTMATELDPPPRTFRRGGPAPW